VAADDAAVTVTLRANVKDYEAALKNAVRATERAAAAAEKAISSVGKGTGGGTSAVNDNFRKSANQIANDARMLQFQLNDIFSGIASGQGIRAVQMQLGQIAQQLSGGSMAQGARTLGSALVGMVNPINLAVVAFGALATVAASYFLESEEGAEKATDALEKQATAARKAADEFGALLPGLNELADRLERIAEMNRLIASAGTITAEAMKGVADALAELNLPGGEMGVAARMALDDIKAAGDDVIQTLSEGKDATEEYLRLHKLLSEFLESPAVKANEALRQSVIGLMDAYNVAAEAAANLAKQQKAAAAPSLPGLSDQDFNQRFGQPYAKPWEEMFPDLYRKQEEARKAAERAAKERTREAERAAKEAERAAKEAAEKIDEAVANQTAVAVDAVTGLLGKSEKTNAAEINAFLKRGGVDLDSATTAWCAAFVNSALAQIGVQGTGSQVATSFANWGRGVGLGQLQRGDVLVQSRGRAPGQTGGHVGFATGNVRTIGDQITEVEMISGNAADKVTQEWVEASSVIARRATEAFELSGEALEHLGTEASAAAAATKKAADDLAAMNQQMANIVGGGLSQFVSDLIAGEDAGDAFANMLQRITSQLLDMFIQMMIIKPLMNSIFGGTGGGGILGFEGGGTVGLSGHPAGKRPAALWANAPRYAQGGMVGLRPGEVPIIAHRGEIIVPNARRLASSTGGGRVDNSVHQQNKISIDMAGSGYVAANSENAKAVGENIQKLIQAELVREARPGGLLRKVPR
jgi:uncharacterized protein (TIGR02594 family)